MADRPSSLADAKKAKKKKLEDGARKGDSSDSDSDRDPYDGVEFEDPYGDEYDDEELDAMKGDDEEMEGASGKAPAAGASSGAMEAEDEEFEDEEESEDEGAGASSKGPEKKQVLTKVFRGEAKKGEEMEHDPAAYHMLHPLRVEWPSLSFDFWVEPGLAPVTSYKYPVSAWVLAGTQADRPNNNSISIMKCSNLCKTFKAQRDDEEESDTESESSDVDEDPILESKNVKHVGGVNRIRAMPQARHIVATWSETKSVHVYDLSGPLLALRGAGAAAPSTAPPANPLVYTYRGHPEEGFAMDWSPVSQARLATGDCSGKIFAWTPQSGGTSWAVDKTPFTGHESSVEDIQWSPTESEVFASCSSDQTVKIWDSRSKKGAALSVDAHSSDVNVISWNRLVTFLIASGCDDGSIKIWDLRKFKSDQAVAEFKFNTNPITSIEWHPTDSPVLAASSEDMVTVWDMSIEKDTEEEATGEDDDALADIPPQLLFIHQGQTNIKETHWHPYYSGMLTSTAESGIHIFKPINT